MKLAERSTFFAGLFTTLLICGCTIGADFQSPDLASSLQGRWHSAEAAGAHGPFEDHAPQPAWWDQFHDAYLSRLIDDLVAANLTLARARERIIEARAHRGIAQAGQLPQADLTAQAIRAGTGEEAVTFQGPPPGREADIYALGTVAGWELDLWGRIDHLVEAQGHAMEAEREALRGISVSLAADLTLAYIEARTLETRLGLLNRKIAVFEQVFALSQAREAAGNGSRLARVKAEKQFHQLQAVRPEVSRQLKIALNRIDVLLGRMPQGESLPPGELPEVPALIGLGLPADLLIRRADIREAEQRYVASVARVGAAMAEKYPRISLSGSFILQSNTAGGVLDPQALVYSLGPKLHFPLFSGGRLDSQVRVRQSQSEQNRLALEETLIIAVREVEDAASGLVQMQLQLAELKKVQASALESRTMTDHLYRTGLQSRDTVLTAERELLSVEEDLLLVRRSALRQTVMLYRALGGGWSAMALKPSSPVSPDTDNHNRHAKGDGF